MKFIRSVFGVVLVSCLSANPGVAVARVNEQVSDPTSQSQAESVMIAGFFDISQDLKEKY